LQWYIGGKSRTTCTANGCEKRNIIVHALTREELSDLISPFLNNEFVPPEEEKYYMERLEEI
jgi:hypothetical protein